MDTALWIAQALLAIAFGISGVMKIITPREKALEKQAWVEDVSQNQLRLIGIAEVAAAFGLILPGLLDIATFLTTLAAVGLILIMVGAMSLHYRRNEHQVIVVNVILLMLAVFVAWGRAGDYPL